MNEPLSSLRFQRRPFPVLPEHRPLYKIAQILLILRLASRGGKSSLTRLHLFNWALKDAERSQRLSHATRTKNLNVTAWGFDPALAIALRFAEAERLVRTSGASYEITELGEQFARAVESDEELLREEKAALAGIGKGITELMVESVAKSWGKQ